MPDGILGTLTIGQAPRADVVPIIDRHVPARVKRIHQGVLDGMTRRDIAARYEPEGDEPALITRLLNGDDILLSRARMKDGVQQALHELEAAGCDVILLLCTGTFDGLGCDKAWLVEPDHIIPGMVRGLIEDRQLGIIVPIEGQIDSESGKWRGLARTPIFAVASPYEAGREALVAAGAGLKAKGAAALLLDCIGFTEEHRGALAGLEMPVILSNAVVAKAVGELFGG